MNRDELSRYVRDVSVWSLGVSGPDDDGLWTAYQRQGFDADRVVERLRGLPGVSDVRIRPGTLRVVIEFRVSDDAPAPPPPQREGF